MYENSPYNILARHNVNNMDEARQNVLGGETAIWTEQSDAGNILSKVKMTNTTHLNPLVRSSRGQQRTARACGWGRRPGAGETPTPGWSTTGRGWW